MMRAGLVLLGLLLSSPTWAMEHYVNVVQDKQGNGIRGVEITVYQAGTSTLATLYSDNGTTTLANPLSSELDGSYDFYAANGVYDLTFVRSGYSFNNVQYRRIALFDLNDFSGGGGGGGGSSAFNDVTTGVNTLATMTVGSGASLTYSGTGLLNASRYRGNLTVAVGDGGTGLTSSPDDSLLVGNGTAWQVKTVADCQDVSGQHLNYIASTNTFGCGTSSLSSAFSSLTSGANSLASMTVASGASLTYSGSGTVNASSYRGNTTIGVGDGGTGLTSATDDAILIGNGSAYVPTVFPSCNNPVTSKLLYDTGTNALTCGTDQSSGGGTTWDAVGSGTNTVSAFVVGSGASMVPTGTGIITATASKPNVLTINAGNSPYTAVTTDFLLLCDTTAAARIINLPAATGKQLYRVKNLGSNTCTINRAGADTIDGSSSAILRNQYDAIDLVADASATWSVF